jgi:uncharacterized integral membrane protein
VKHLSWIITVPVMLVVVVFALANRHAAMLRFWPFPWSTELPIYVIVLCCLLVGFLVGAAFAWLSAGPRRRRARETAERARELARQVAELKRQNAAQLQAAQLQAAQAAAAAPALAGQPGRPAPAALEHLPGA